ncbi:hemerythrin domain-containing protein [Myxococcota bacterium]|nr:hemerythrin domain-containing protein [Myxococcota bacterium]
MKRDPRLHGLSAEHHHALVLARSLVRARTWTLDDGAQLRRRFDDELEVHFGEEERVLLPAMRAFGDAALVERTLADHAVLRALVARAAAGDGDAARELGAQLHAHVRFEERELFPALEAALERGLVLPALRPPRRT